VTIQRPGLDYLIGRKQIQTLPNEAHSIVDVYSAATTAECESEGGMRSIP